MAFPIFVNAQAVSGVTGVVTDSTGAVIPGVDVLLTDTKTSKELSTKTNDQGVYSFSNIPPGEGYKITFTIQNFQTFVVSDVSLGVGKTETRNATLNAGSVGASVEVIAAPGDTLNTTDASIGNVIDTRQLRELPIQIRSSPAALIGLQPGVVGNNVGTGSTNRVGSVTGSRADQGNITVDGIDANDQATGQAFATVGNAPIDAIQEFRAVTTNPNSAEGRSAGGQIQLVTKSGTNQFHGSLYEYNRTAATAANSFFNNASRIARPQLTRNQFGGSLGGPLPFPRFGELGKDVPFFSNGKDKLFFFFNYEGRRDAQGVSYVRTVPLNNFRNGQIGYINNTAGCGATSRQNTTPQCISFLSAAQIAQLDPRGIGVNTALLSFINSRYPQANDLTVGDGINTGGFRFNAPSKRSDNTYTTRIDGNITDKQKIFGRLNIARRTQNDTVNSVAAQFPGDPTSSLIVQKDYSLAIGYTYVISDSLFNSLIVGNSHSGLDFPNDFKPSFPNTYTFGNSSTLGALLTGPYASISTQSRIVDTPTIRDDATYTVGKHTFQFGVSFKPIRSQSGLVNDFNAATLGLGGILNSLTAGVRPSATVGATPISTGTTATRNYDRAFAFILGRIASVQTNFNYSTTGQAFAPGTGKSRDYRYNEYEYYVQDNWKIRSDLTINLGVRYQYYPAPYEANGFQAANDVNIDQLFPIRVANGAAGIAGNTSEPLLTYTLIGKGNDGRPFYKTDKNNFAPRIGFAYNPSFKDGFLGKVFGDRKTSIRGGASKVYERISGGVTFIADQVSYLFDSSATSNFGSLANDPRFTGIATLPVSNTPPLVSNPNTPFVDPDGTLIGNANGETSYAIDQKFKIPFSYQFSLGVQRELPGNFLLDVSYVGRLGRKLFTQADAAQIVDFRDPASGQTLLQALGALQNGSTANQPFFENQGALALGAPCTDFVASCTDFIISNFGGLIDIGDASDTVQAMYASGILRANVGLSGQFSTNAFVTNLGKSSYHGMLISLQKRFSQGYQFDFNYSFSKSLDNNSSVANTVFGGLVCDLRNPNLCKGPSDFDIRHLINVNGIWELPIGRGKFLGRNMNGFLDQIFGGFQVSGIYTYRSGLPFNPTTGSFPIGFVLDSPAVLVNNSQAVHGSINTTSTGSVQFFSDPDAALNAFRSPQVGTIGNRNVLRGPSFWNLDLGLQKSFKLPWENTRLQIRADAFNVFNHNAFGLPTININGANFGQITTTATAPRELQFAVRFDF